MDPGPRPALPAVWLMMVGLLGTAAGLYSGVTTCLCPEIPRIPLTKTPPSNCTQRYRYECSEGYVRKAGTSSLLHCKEDVNGGPPFWNPPDLECIPDPRLPPKPKSTTDPNKTTTQPPNSTVTKGRTDFPRHSAFTTTVTPSETTSSVRINSSASVTAGPGGTETTSQPDPELSQGGKDDVTPRWPTSDSTPVNQRGNAETWPHAVPAIIGCSSLVIICSLIGISVFCYKRRSIPAVPPGSPEEFVPMNIGYLTTEQEHSGTPPKTGSYIENI